jgi:hypothetical protein
MRFSITLSNFLFCINIIASPQKLRRVVPAVVFGFLFSDKLLLDPNAYNHGKEHFETRP